MILGFQTAEALVPGARRIDDAARQLIVAHSDLRELVCEAVQEMRKAFDDAQIDVEYFVDPDSDELDQRIVVAAYTSRGGRVEQLSRVHRNWWVEHPRFGKAPLVLSAHAV